MIRINSTRPFLQTSIRVLFLWISVHLSSCNTPKYTFTFDSGKYTDFGKGKWVMNQTKSNSKIFNTELYTVSVNEFRKILGDSLMEINDLRRNKLIAPEIPFDLGNDKLLELKEQTGCDYIINVRGRIIKEGIGALSIPSDEPYYNGSNEPLGRLKFINLKQG